MKIDFNMIYLIFKSNAFLKLFIEILFRYFVKPSAKLSLDLI